MASWKITESEAVKDCIGSFIFRGAHKGEHLRVFSGMLSCKRNQEFIFSEKVRSPREKKGKEKKREFHMCFEFSEFQADLNYREEQNKYMEIKI